MIANRGDNALERRPLTSPISVQSLQSWAGAAEQPRR